MRTSTRHSLELPLATQLLTTESTYVEILITSSCGLKTALRLTLLELLPPEHKEEELEKPST